MPIYEYHCPPCRHTFETLIRGQGDTAHCPQCGGIDLVKQFSVPAAAQTGSGASASRAGLPVCGDPGEGFGCGQGGCGSGMCSFDD
jgi:putative FmdB family regulatory protein